MHVLEVPGHTPGHLALWSPDERVLVVADTLSTYDVGWVNMMRGNQAGIDDSLTSLGVLTRQVGQARDGGLVPAGSVGSVVVVLVQPCWQSLSPLGF